MSKRSLKTVVEEDVAAAFLVKAKDLGLSVNQYLKLLVLRDQGQEPPYDLYAADLGYWLRGK